MRYVGLKYIPGAILSTYSNVLLAVDLTEECVPVANKAREISASPSAALHIIHVIEPLSLAYGGDIPMDLSAVQDQIHDQAKSHLAEFASKIAIEETNQHLVFGRPDTEIHRVAEEINADLIVVGSHGRHGLALLLGSTANAVLHGATCDVLAIRVGEDRSTKE